MTPQEESILVLERRLREMEERLALYELNGLADTFNGTGNQTYGGGIMRLDKNGGQILTRASLTPAWFWVPAFTVDPSVELYQGNVGGYALNSASAQQAGMTIVAKAGAVNSSKRAYLDLLADETNVLITATLATKWDATADHGAAVDLASNSTTDGSSVTITGRLRLWYTTADPASATNGAMWYRTDLFRPRFKSNGILGNLGIEIESATAPAIANNGTITTAGVSVARVAPAGAVTGIILAVGTTGGQVCTVVNESVAANTVTFAASGTSNVADGVASVIAGLTARRFTWDGSTALWYPTK